ncbi:MAG: hypothetical protein KF855_03345 [Acidobacteria bacterium]|nr:hypothetical protein [Acidobacteriota bacterium]
MLNANNLQEHQEQSKSQLQRGRELYELTFESNRELRRRGFSQEKIREINDLTYFLRHQAATRANENHKREVAILSRYITELAVNDDTLNAIDGISKSPFWHEFGFEWLAKTQKERQHIIEQNEDETRYAWKNGI